MPYDTTAYATLAHEVRHHGLTANWIRKARPHTVSTFRPKADHPIWTQLEPAPITRNRQSDDWFIYLNEEDYDKELLGLLPPQGPEVWTI